MKTTLSDYATKNLLFSISEDRNSTIYNLKNKVNLSDSIEYAGFSASKIKTWLTSKIGFVLTVITIFYSLHVQAQCENGQGSSYIKEFKTTGGFANINNPSTRGTNGYQDFKTPQYVSQHAGSSVNFSTAFSDVHGVSIYIDWNKNGTFENPAERVYTSNAYVLSATGTIAIPIGQAAGDYTIRVVINYGDLIPGPCNNNTGYGETEDYTLKVLPPPTVCVGTPAGGTASLIPNSGMVGSAVNGSVSGASTNSGLAYQWEYFDGVSWLPISGQTNIGLSTTAINTIGTRMYRRKTTCISSGLFSFSSDVSYTTQDIGMPICNSIQAFCSGVSYQFPNTTSGSSPVGPAYGCLTSRPNPFFYFLRIGTGGNIKLELKQFDNLNNGIDVDFALWGPFTTYNEGCNKIMSGLYTPLQCSFSGLTTETVGLGVPGGDPSAPTTPPAAVAGQIYILLITNFSNKNGYITLNQVGGSGTTDCNVLPIELTNFSSTCNEAINLNWTTASEQNSDRFVIEKSRDGQVWYYVGEKAAAGSSSRSISYSLVDENNWNAISYYRMRQIDLNGEETVYGPISVNCDANENNINVYPNPSHADFKVEISSTEKITDGQIQFVDLAGKVIISQTATIGIGMNQFNFNHVDLETGTYFVKFTGGNSSFQPVKLVIQ